MFNLCVSMFPACLTGLLFHGFIKHHLFSPTTVIIGLVLGGVFMIVAEKTRKGKEFEVTNVDKISTKQAFLIGLFQCVSLWPGFSRSGSTIAGSLLLGISRKAVPLMFLACFYDLLKVIGSLSMGDLGILAVGFVTAFVVAYASILWFLKFLNTSTLTGFAIYRFFVAAFALVYFW